MNDNPSCGELDRRAAQLALLPQAHQQQVNVMLVRVGEEHYAVPLTQLSGVQRAEVTPLPRSAPHVAGLTNVRGELVAVLRSELLLGGAATFQTGRDQTGHDQAGRDQAGRDQAGRDQGQGEVLLTEHQGQTVGLLVSEALGLHALDDRTLTPSLSGAGHARGLSAAGVTWTDLPSLLSSLPPVWRA